MPDEYWNYGAYSASTSTSRIFWVDPACNWNATILTSASSYYINDYIMTDTLQTAGNRSRPAEDIVGIRPDLREVAARMERVEQAWQSKEDATHRSKWLLKSILSERQRIQYEEIGAFTVITPGTRRRYCIREGWAGNVFEINENGNDIARFCIHPDDRMPFADNMIAQKLLLETDEAEFLRIANRSVKNDAGLWVPVDRAA